MISRIKCKNGVRIVLEEMPTLRSVAIGIWIGTGSRYENNSNNGISHFIEHMFFKGTKTRSAKEIAESFDRIGGQVNAFTSKEYTCYYAKVLDSHSDYALDVLSDMFFNSEFENGELQKEKNVVIEEIKMYEDAPDEIVHDLLNVAAYGKHPLAYPILGTEETIHSFTSENLHEYVDAHYAPEDVVISIAGNISKDFLKKVEEIFGSYESKKNEVIIHKPVFHTNKLFKKKDTEQAHVCIGYEGLAAGAPNVFSLVTLNNILGGSMSSRLFQEVREQRGLAYSVFSYHSSFIDSGMVTIYAGTGNGTLHELMDTIMQTVEKLRTDGVTAIEIQNTKEQIKGSFMLGLESSNSRMSRNGKNELVLGKHPTLDEIIEKIDAVNEDTVQELINQIFQQKYAFSMVSPNEADFELLIK